MLMRIRVSSIRYLCFVLLIWCVCSIVNLTLPSNDFGIRVAAIGQFVAFLLLYFAFGRAQGELLSLYAVWLIAFYVFQNGQVLLYSLGFDYDYWYVERYSKKLVFESVCISNHSLCAAFAAGGFAFAKENSSAFEKRMNNLSELAIIQSAKVGWIVSGIVAFVNLLIKFQIVLSLGYDGVMIYEASVPSVIGLIEYFFPVFSILIVVYKNSGKYVNGIVCCFLVWGILTALTGDRTSGIAAVVVVALMYIKKVYSPRTNDTIGFRQGKKTWGRYLVFATTAIFCMYLIFYAFDFRSGSEYNSLGLFDAVVRTVGDLGFSFFPLVLNLQIYPSLEPYMYGKSMISSVICGFIPQSIDFAGITNEIADIASSPMRNIEEYFSYNFGLDCSLIAEGYANFGSYAWIAVFASCCVVASMLTKVDYSKIDNRYSQYRGLALLFMWFTLPRRRSYYVYNHIFWVCIVMSIFLIVMEGCLSRKTK